MAELAVVRKQGMAKLHQLQIDELRAATVATGHAESSETASTAAVEILIREAISEIGSDNGEASLISFGLHPNGQLDRLGPRQQLAAEVLGISPGHFRQVTQQTLDEHLVQIIGRMAYEFEMRSAAVRADVRTPIGSRLAVAWLDRFEAMYRVWTPVSGLGASLTAYRSTLLEPGRPWDREPDPGDPSDDGHSQEDQARGYVLDAFYFYASVMAAEREFIDRFGGMWILPDQPSEQALADALHRIRLSTPNEIGLESYLLSNLRRLADGGQFTFLSWANSDDLARSAVRIWIDWSATCDCDWSLGTRVGQEKFPVAPNHPGVDHGCDVHGLVSACNEFMLILDDAWLQIADWYAIEPGNRSIGVSAEELMSRRPSPLPRHELDKRNNPRIDLDDHSRKAE